LAKRRPPNHHTIELAGRMETELTAARLAHQSMLAAVRLNAPSAETVNQVMIGRHLVARHAIAAVDLAMELAGGAGFYRSAGLERKFRDIQAARYHPLQSGPQAQYAGAMEAKRRSNPVFARVAGVLRGACHRARIRATRWLAMTKKALPSGAPFLFQIAWFASRNPPTPT
jgi:hypothetical protein